MAFIWKILFYSFIIVFVLNDWQTPFVSIYMPTFKLFLIRIHQCMSCQILYVRLFEMIRGEQNSRAKTFL